MSSQHLFLCPVSNVQSAFTCIIALHNCTIIYYSTIHIPYLIVDDIIIMAVRGTRDEIDGYQVLLAVTLNDLTTNGGKMSLKQQEEVFKVRALDWIPILSTNYSHVPLSIATIASLHIQVENDRGANMLRKAKELVGFIVNSLNPFWKDPSSGQQISDCLRNCIVGAFAKIEEAKKIKNPTYVVQPFDERWRPKELLTFRYFGVVAGR